MKLSRSITIAAALGAAFAFSACSQNVSSGPEEPTGETTSGLGANAPSAGHPDFAAMAARRFQEVDKDSDGKVTADEIRAASSAKFSEVDANHDGQLDEAELSAMASGFKGRRGGPPLAKLDTNGDGKVSAEEFVSHAATRWQHSDADGDGVVTSQEWQARGAGKAGRGPGMGMHGERGGMRGAGGPMMETMFQQADANHDGKVTRAEADALRTQKFAQADTNHDGKLDEAELVAMRGEHRSDRMGEHFAKLDRDGDGKISKEEAPPRMAAMFDQADTDRDGKLSVEELKAAHPMGREHAAKGREGVAGRGPLAMMDKDGDGSISAQEFAAMPDRWFGAADANKDGAVTLEELRAARPGPMRR